MLGPRGLRWPIFLSGRSNFAVICKLLISGVHRASLLLITFINQPMHSTETFVVV